MATSDMPAGWDRVSLADVGAFHKGYGGTKKDQTESGVPVVRYGELYARHHDIIRRFHSYVSRESAVNYAPLRSGDLLFAASGETLSEIGKSAAFLGPEPAHTGGDVIILRPNHRADPAFLGYASNAPDAVSQKSRMGQGSSVMHIHVRQLEQLALLLPPLGEQRKIAAILSSIDDTIEKTEDVIAQLEVVKKAMMQELLTRGMPGRHTRFRQTDIGEIPAAWDVAWLRDVAHVVRGSTPRPARDPRYFNGSHTPWITVTELARDDTPYLDSTASHLTAEGAERSRRLRAGTVVLSNSGFGLGVPKILRIDGCANDGIAAFLDLSSAVVPLYLYYSLACRTEYLRTSVARGVEQPNLNTTLIGDLPLPLPSPAEQSEIVDALAAFDTRLAGERAVHRVFADLKRSTSAVLLAGDLRVASGEAAP